VLRIASIADSGKKTKESQAEILHNQHVYMVFGQVVTPSLAELRVLSSWADKEMFVPTVRNGIHPATLDSVV